VTGAGSGIGRATARAFAREGARVVVADRDRESAEETVAGIAAEGGIALGIEVDVSDEEQVAAMIRATVERFGALHCASNNAALGVGFRPLTEIDRERWDRCIGVTLTGV
jgi:NAD(P)-dependent dehydrogenase (short-subunit alcohol dehydrogenase family)